MRATLLTASLVALLAAAPVASGSVASGFNRTSPVASGFSRTKAVASGFSRTNAVASGFSRTGAQKPVPFPRPTAPPTAPPPAKPSDPAPPVAAPAQPGTAQPAGVPTEETLGAPIYPGSQYITSYDAGSGQRFYLFGTNTDFAQIVAYYRNVMRTRGDEVFREPGIHMFDIARFRSETMAFPPSVTVKDYTWGGSQGFLNPTPGAEPARYRTIIQIVPEPGRVSGR